MKTIWLAVATMASLLTLSSAATHDATVDQVIVTTTNTPPRPVPLTTNELPVATTLPVARTVVTNEPPILPVDVSRLGPAFQSTGAANEEKVAQAIAAIRNRNYSAAGAILRDVLTTARLSPDQVKAVQDVLAQLEPDTPVR